MSYFDEMIPKLLFLQRDRMFYSASEFLGRKNFEKSLATLPYTIHYSPVGKFCRGFGWILRAWPCPLKGIMSRNGYFFEGLKKNILIITFCVCADGFQGLSKA
jgi:hypothetical protein